MKNKQKYYAKVYDLIVYLVMFTLIFNFCFNTLNLVSAKNNETAIDTFNVHPANRWEFNYNEVDSVDCEYSMLNISDAGGSWDRCMFSRGLKSINDKVIIRQKFDYDIGYNATSFHELSYFYIFGNEGNIYFQSGDFRPSNMGTCKFGFYSTTNEYIVYQIEALEYDVWYRFEIEFDLYKSEINYKLYNDDNGSKLYDIDYQDFPGSYTPKIFMDEYLSVRFYDRFEYSQNNFKHYIDYVDAPFSLNNWKITDTPADSDFLFYSYDSAYAQDNIDDTAKFECCIPQLDSFSGETSCDINNHSNLASTFTSYSAISFYNTEYDDGNKALIGRFLMVVVSMDGSNYMIQLEGRNGNDAQTFVDYWSIAKANWVPIALSFSIDLSENRNKLQIQSILYDNALTESILSRYDYSLFVDDYVTDPSQEFVIETEYYMDFDDDIEIKYALSNLNVIEKDIFSDLIGLGQGFINGLVGLIIAAFAVILLPCFRFLADVLVTVIQSLIDTFEPLISALQSTLDNIFSILGDILSALGDIAQDIIDGLIGVLQDILDIITDLAVDFVLAIIDLASDILDEFIPLLIGFLSDFVDVILGIVFWIVDNTPFLSDFAVALEDYVLYAIDIVQAIPQFLEDVYSWLFLNFPFFLVCCWAFIFIKSFSQNNWTFWGGISGVIDESLRGPDVEILGNGPFRFSLGLFLLFPLTMFLVVFPAFEIINIW